MRSVIFANLALALALLSCGAGPSQTGTISGCNGITLSGAGAFKPLSGMAFQVAADLGEGMSAPGTYEIVIWASSPDAGTPKQSYSLTCQDLVAGDYATSSLFLPPETLDFDLPDSLSSTSYETSITVLTQPYSQSSSILEDILGNVDISSVGTQCLTGDFTANLVPVDPASNFAIDGGVVSPISGSFSLPFCG
jgi:hypothetical protein